jgi:hypothetical protein
VTRVPIYASSIEYFAIKHVNKEERNNLKRALSLSSFLSQAIFILGFSHNNSSLHKHSKSALIATVSFPDVVGAFTPTVRSTLVNTIPTLRITKKILPTHTNANKSI